MMPKNHHDSLIEGDSEPRFRRYHGMRPETKEFFPLDSVNLEEN